MNKLLTSLLFLSLAIASPAQTDTLRVISYNIWNGYDWGKDQDRRMKTLEWINDQAPDIVALQELVDYTAEELKEDAESWGHSYSVILKKKGYPVGITSNQPIELKEKLLDDLWHGMLHVSTHDLDLFIVHLSPADADFRLKEANIIAERVKSSQSDQFLILGDFNAHSPFDGDVMKANTRLLDKYRKSNNEKHDNLRLKQFDYSTISTFLALPARDVCHQFMTTKNRYSYPTPALIGSWIEKKEDINHERIDYILASPILAGKCVGATIANGEETAQLSDHYPVIAEFVK